MPDYHPTPRNGRNHEGSKQCGGDRTRCRTCDVQIVLDLGQMQPETHSCWPVEDRRRDEPRPPRSRRRWARCPASGSASTRSICGNTPHPSGSPEHRPARGRGPRWRLSRSDARAGSPSRPPPSRSWDSIPADTPTPCSPVDRRRGSLHLRIAATGSCTHHCFPPPRKSNHSRGGHHHAGTPGAGADSA